MESNEITLFELIHFNNRALALAKIELAYYVDNCGRDSKIVARALGRIQGLEQMKFELESRTDEWRSFLR